MLWRKHMDEHVSRGRVILDVAAAAWPWVALAVLFAAPGCCVVPLPLFLVLAGRAYEHAMGVRRSHGSRAVLGALGAPLFYVPLLSYVVVASLVEGTGEPRWQQAGLTVVASCSLTTLLFPLYGAPFESVARGGTTLESILASGAQAARHGVGATLAHATAVGAIGAAPWALFVLVEEHLRTQPAALLPLLFVAAWLAVTIDLGLVAHFWSGGRERFGAARGTTPLGPPRAAGGLSVRGRLAGSLILGLAPAVMLGAVLVVALVTPTPAWQVEASTTTRDPGLDLAGRSDRDPLVLEPQTGLRVYPLREDTWRVETADGGGAGDVRIRGAIERSAFVRGGRHGARPTWSVCAQAQLEVRCVTFDAQGVRIDDTPVDRLRERLGPVGLALSALYVVALALLALAQARRAGVAAQLDGPRYDGSRETAAFVGVLRTEAPLAIDRGVLVVRGSATLTLGEHGSVRLPEGRLPLQAPPGTPRLVDGAELTLIAALAGSKGSPFRDGAAPMPRGAKLVVGSLERAREMYAEHVARLNVLAALPMLVVALGLSVAVLARL
jgi:hypothetical protein